jgi:hypothetical protein
MSIKVDVVDIRHGYVDDMVNKQFNHSFKILPRIGDLIEGSSCYFFRVVNVVFYRDNTIRIEVESIGKTQRLT